jgi:hypothetical protein
MPERLSGFPIVVYIQALTSATGQGDLRCLRTNNARIVIKVTLFTPEENRFLDVVLGEATTAPFTGPATTALHRYGLEYGDLSYIAWAYDQEVPRTGAAVGHATEIAPPLPRPNRQSTLRRNQEIQRIPEQRQQGGEMWVGKNERERNEDLADL